MLEVLPSLIILALAFCGWGNLILKAIGYPNSGLSEFGWSGFAGLFVTAVVGSALSFFQPLKVIAFPFALAGILLFGIALIVFGMILGSIAQPTPAPALPIPYTPAPLPVPVVPIAPAVCPIGCACGAATSVVTLGVVGEVYEPLLGSGRILGAARGIASRVASVLPGHDRRVARREARRE